MRAVPLLLEPSLEDGEVLVLPGLDHLRGEIGALVGDETPGALDAVRGEEPPREEPVDRPVEVERVARHETGNLLPEGVRVAQTPEHASRDHRAELRVVFAGPVGVRLAEVVQQCRQAHGELVLCVRGVLHDLEEVLVERRGLPLRAEVVADRRPVLGKELDERARVAREPESLRRLRSEQELRQLAHPVGGQSAADPLGRDMAQAGRLGPHLPERLVRERERQLGEEPQAAQNAQRVLPEAVRADGVELTPLEVLQPPEGIDQLAGLEPAGHGVDREVAPRHVVRDRHRRVGDDLEVAMARPDAPFLSRRRQLDPRGSQRADRTITRVEADTDELAVHLHVLDGPVRLERGAQARVVDARHEKVFVRMLDSEELVAHRSPDDVRVEAERADVASDLGRHGRARYISPCAQRCAIASISTRAPDGSWATWNVDRAGGRSPTRAA